MYNLELEQRLEDLSENLIDCKRDNEITQTEKVIINSILDLIQIIADKNEIQLVLSESYNTRHNYNL